MVFPMKAAHVLWLHFNEKAFVWRLHRCINIVDRTHFIASILKWQSDRSAAKWFHKQDSRIIFVTVLDASQRWNCSSKINAWILIMQKAHFVASQVYYELSDSRKSTWLEQFQCLIVSQLGKVLLPRSTRFLSAMMNKRKSRLDIHGDCENNGFQFWNHATRLSWSVKSFTVFIIAQNRYWTLSSDIKSEEANRVSKSITKCK